jgi:hypothetical protein
MSEMSLRELQSLFSTEYARLIFLNQAQELDLDLSDDEDEEDDDCSSCCSDKECDEECDSDGDDEDEDGMIDANEYAVCFSVVRLVTYFQAMMEKVYRASHSHIQEIDFEMIMKWGLEKKYIKNERDVETLAILFTFVHETVTAMPANQLVCYTQDKERLPLLSQDNFVQSIETLSTIVQSLVKER